MQTNGKLFIIMATENGKGLRFSETIVRSMGRTASGVRGMKIAADDRLASVDVAAEEDFLLVVGEKGIGKRTPVQMIPPHGRSTSGVMITNKKALPVTGKVIAACVLRENYDVTFITSLGNVVRLKGTTIPVKGRTARGVRLVRLTDGATVAAVTSNDADLILDNVVSENVLPPETQEDMDADVFEESDDLDEELDEAEEAEDAAEAEDNEDILPEDSENEE